MYKEDADLIPLPYLSVFIEYWVQSVVFDYCFVYNVSVQKYHHVRISCVAFILIITSQFETTFCIKPANLGLCMKSSIAIQFFWYNENF